MLALFLRALALERLQRLERYDVSFDEDGQPDRLRVRMSAPLGFGQRTVEVSRGMYMLFRRHVVLELSADDLRSLPDVGAEIDEKRAE